MNRLRLIWIAAVLCGLFACKGRELPGQRPAGLVIELNEGGGMMPEGSRYYISKDSCYVRFWHDRVKNTYRYKLDSTALDKLYRVIYENEFERIRTRQMETYDRGGISVTLHYGDNDIHVDDAGSTYVNKEWAKNFNAVTSAIMATAGNALKENHAELTVKFSPNMLADSLTLNFRVENAAFSSGKEKKEAASFGLLKGLHQYSVELLVNKAGGSEGRLEASYEGIASVCGDHDTLYVAMDDSSSAINCRKNIECDAR